MTLTTPEIARRRAAFRRISHSISMEGGRLPADLTTDADEYARGAISEDELVERVRRRFGIAA
ncbi:MAG: hypothetical protein ACOH16_11285 [Propionibacteriaceae bacterium]|jgi:hypothetical protein